MQDNDTKEILLSWLKGQSGQVAGKRVLLYTYGNVGYLGAYDSGDNQFVNRYHVERGRITKSSLKGCANDEEKDFSLACGRKISDLTLQGLIRQTEPPRQYDNAVMLFELV